MSDKPQTLFGLPIIVSDQAPKGEIIFGTFPNAKELEDEGLTFEEWVRAHPTRFVKVTGIEE